MPTTGATRCGLRRLDLFPQYGAYSLKLCDLILWNTLLRRFADDGVDAPCLTFGAVFASRGAVTESGATQERSVGPVRDGSPITASEACT